MEMYQELLYTSKKSLIWSKNLENSQAYDVPQVNFALVSDFPENSGACIEIEIEMQ